MTERKFTDEEIIKALECCVKSSHFGECFENKCPLVSEHGCKVGKETLYPYALDLITRQRTEIEEKSNKLREILPIVAELKAEALTEYVIELEKRLIAGGLGIAFVRSQMYKLLKEKTEGKDELD